MLNGFTNLFQSIFQIDSIMNNAKIISALSKPVMNKEEFYLVLDTYFEFRSFSKKLQSDHNLKEILLNFNLKDKDKIKNIELTLKNTMEYIESKFGFSPLEEGIRKHIDTYESLNLYNAYKNNIPANKKNY